MPVPIFLLLFGGVGIAAGIGMAGHRVMDTIGKKITTLTNTRGFAVDFAAATTVLVASKLGLPVSTTHAAVGGVMGVGFARGMEAVNFRIIFQIMLYLGLTVPAAAITSMVVFKILKFITLEEAAMRYLFLRFLSPRLLTAWRSTRKKSKNVPGPFSRPSNATFRTGASFDEFRKEIIKIGKEADAVKRRIRGHLPKGTLMQVDKFELFDIWGSRTMSSMRWKMPWTGFLSEQSPASRKSSKKTSALWWMRSWTPSRN